MKIRPVGVEFFHAHRRIGRQADIHDNANRHFSQFCDCVLTVYRICQ